jgi:hypothetical protein
MPAFTGTDRIPSPEGAEPVLPERTRRYLEHGAPEGQRNSELFEAACQCRDCGFLQDYTAGLLGPRAEADGLKMGEILRTIQSAYDRAPREPIFGKNGEAGQG